MSRDRMALEQPSTEDTVTAFNGPAYSYARYACQIKRTFDVMKDGRWRTPKRSRRQRATRQGVSAITISSND